MTAARWPVHPAPIPGEAASSWLTRLAAALHIDAGVLLDDLGYHLNTMVELDDLTIAMPARLARRLAARTGTPTRRIRRTCLAGYRPGLIGTPLAHNQYAAYTQQYSILPAPGTRRYRRLYGWLAWLPTDGILTSQSCPSCLPKDTAPPHAYLLAWAIPILLTCPIHRCRLVSAADPTASYYEPPPSPAVTAMDTYTWQALTTGRVTLPGETIPARVWFRLLRTIIDEITDLPADPDNMRAALQPAGAGVRPAGAEQDNWQPYEGLDCYAQDRALQAAAAVIATLQDGTITGHGTAAHLFRTHHRQPGPPFATHF